MLIYNITTKMVAGIEDAWLEWAKTEFIPGAIASGCFNSGRVMRLLDVDDEEGPTYAIQLEFTERKQYDRWNEEYAGASTDEAFRRWGNQFISFKSLLAIVN